MAHVQASVGIVAVMLGGAQARAEYQAGPLTLTRVVTLAEVAATQGGMGVTGDRAEAPNPADERNAYGITGNWGGVRDTLAGRGIFVAGYVNVDVTKVLRAGLNTRAWPTSYLLDLNVLADMEKATGWKGGTAFLDFQSHDESGNREAAVGDIQGFDNTVSPRFVQIAQLWYKQVLGESLRVKVGKIDGNSDAAGPGEDAHEGFSIIEHGLNFIHSAAAYPPPMFPMTTYPSYGPGLEVFYGDEAYAGVGAFYSNSHQTFLNISGHPESTQAARGGMFIIGEAGMRYKASLFGAADLPGHAAVGGWYHTGEFPEIATGELKHGAGGAYFFVDQSLFHEEKKDGAVRDVGFFINGGYSDKSTSPMDRSAAFGINASGLVPGRPDDSLGVLTTWAHLPAQPGLLHPMEVATEAYYNIQLTQWASIKPDFQYIVSPSGKVPDAALVLVRVQINF